MIASSELQKRFGLFAMWLEQSEKLLKELNFENGSELKLETDKPKKKKISPNSISAPNLRTMGKQGT